MAWVIWLSLNWVRCSALCLLIAASTDSYRLRAYALATAGWFASFVPLEIFCPDVTMDQTLRYSSLAAYIVLVTIIINRHDRKKG